MPSSKRFLAVLAALVAPLLTGADKRPNFVVIVADDLGYSDIGAYGSEIQTPNIDRLADQGVRFTEFYNASRCCPTRASLLTGRYPHQVNLHLNGNSLSQQVPTIAEVLVRNGYRTAMSGKWHLTKTERITGESFQSETHLRWVNNQAFYDRFGDLSTYPTSRGFEQFYGVIWGVVNYFDPFSLVDGTTPVRTVPDDYYITDAITDHAVDDINEFAAGDDPFFLYVAYTAPHWPLHALPQDIAKYEGVYDEGWDAVRAKRYTRLIEQGLIDPVTAPLPPLDRGNRPQWEHLSSEDKAKEVARMKTHAAMIDRMDQGIGRIFDSLRKSGQWDNTVVLFMSDNGASPEEVKAPGYDRPSETRDGRPTRYAGELEAEDFGTEICWGGIGPAWANTGNTPFRFWKKESFDAGNHTPVILHWPNGEIKAGGGFEPTLAHVIDLAPTFLEMAGADYPSTFDEKPLKPMDGKSLLPILRGKAPSETDRTLYFEHEGTAGIRDGFWKMVRRTPESPWHLFDLAVDRTEKTNLASFQPDRVAELEAKWQSWYEQVLPEEFAKNIVTQD